MLHDAKDGFADPSFISTKFWLRGWDEAGDVVYYDRNKPVWIALESYYNKTNAKGGFSWFVE